jgi:hypothetical protein
MTDPWAGYPGALRDENDRMTTALKQIADLTTTLIADARPDCNCVVCRIHRIAVERRGEL